MLIPRFLIPRFSMLDADNKKPFLASQLGKVVVKKLILFIHT